MRDNVPMFRTESLEQFPFIPLCYIRGVQDYKSSSYDKWQEEERKKRIAQCEKDKKKLDDFCKQNPSLNLCKNRNKKTCNE